MLQEIKNKPWFEWSLKTRLILSFIFFSWILLMFLFFDYFNQWNIIQNNESQINQLRINTADVDQILAQAPHYLEQQDFFLENAKPLLIKQKPISNLATLLTTLSTIAFQTHLVVTTIKPAPAVKGNESQVIPIQLKLEGDYHAMALFLAKLTEIPFILSFNDMAIESSGTTLVVIITLWTYWESTT